MKVCVIIPAFNEEGNIGHLVGKLLPQVNPVRDRRSYGVKGVLVIDDGSTDSTALRAREAGAEVIRHEANRGKGASLRTGFNWVLQRKYDGVITMDGDGQHDADEIPAFLHAAEEKKGDIIIGCRMDDVKRMPLDRLWTNRVTSFITSLLSGQRVRDSQSGYRFIRSEVLEDIDLATSNFEIESEVIIKASRKGYRIAEIPVRTIYGNGRSKIRAFRDTLGFIRLIFRSLFLVKYKRQSSG